MAEEGEQIQPVDSHTPANLLQLKENLFDEFEVLRKAKTAEELSVNSKDIMELRKSIAELKNQLFEESNTVSWRKAIIKQFERHPLLAETLFKADKDERETTITSKCLEDLTLVSEIMQTQEEIKEVQRKYEKIKLDNLKLRQENTVLMEKLKAEKEKACSGSELVTGNKEYKQLKSELDVRTTSLIILKNIIPLLAVNAGLTENNPEMQELILECREPLNL